MTPTTPIWRLLLPLTAMGVGMAFIWAPLATTATRNLPPRLAGAGSGVYNATRQVGSVLGSAGMAAFMAQRIGALMPSGPGGPAAQESAVRELPGFLHEPFAAALSQSLLLPAFVALFGVIAALFFIGDAAPHRGTELLTRRGGDRPIPVHEGWDDDFYFEYKLDDHGAVAEPADGAVDDDTDRIRAVGREPDFEPEPVHLAHNGFHRCGPGWLGRPGGRRRGVAWAAPAERRRRTAPAAALPRGRRGC